MKIAFVLGDRPNDDLLFQSVATGILRSGDEVQRLAGETLEPQPLACDFIGLNGLRLMNWLRYCLEHRQQFLYFDKGYRRLEKDRQKFWRVSVNETHPADYIGRKTHDSTRVKGLKKAMGLPVEMRPWREVTADGPIVIASSSEKFHALHNLPPPREWVIAVMSEIRRHTDRPILYRPKPSWGYTGSIDGSRCVVGIKYMDELFEGCHALVTYGSYICVDAMLLGIPSVVLGNGVLRHISSTAVSEIESPRLATDKERAQALANLAWCQYTTDEWQNGFAWSRTKRLFLERPA